MLVRALDTTQRRATDAYASAILNIYGLVATLTADVWRQNLIVHYCAQVLINCKFGEIPQIGLWYIMFTNTHVWMDGCMD